ncbi:MAG: 50S ribosomal protein L13 [Chloroflexi bacterium]|jgi:large subunit ribosomal protein L13|nr:50S ribosomal protein L13 [Chloroflexota bacterium]
MKTYSTKGSDIKREWHVIDASGQILGRMSTEIAQLLKGKHKPIYARNLDTGDFVIVINAGKVRVTGNKARQKIYYRHSGYPGGLKEVTFERMIETHPVRVVEHAVRGMLPKNVLGRAMFRKLKVYEGPTHPHQAQIKEGSKAEEG